MNMCDWCMGEHFIPARKVGGMTPLHNVKTAKDCKELIKQGSDVNALDPKGRTPLHHAILKKRGLEVVKELLRNGAKVNTDDDYLCRSLLAAIQVGDSIIVRELLRHGADPNYDDREGVYFLNRALHTNDINVVKELLEWGAQVHPFRLREIGYTPPLYEAYRRGGEYAMTFIRMTVLKHFDNKYEEILELNNPESGFMGKLQFYMKECAYQVLGMKCFMISNDYSLFKCLINSRTCNKPIYWDYYTVIEFYREAKMYFPNYKGLIFESMALCLNRGNLFSELRDHQLYIRASYDCRQVSLNTDCCFKIAKYLSNDDVCIY